MSIREEEEEEIIEETSSNNNPAEEVNINTHSHGTDPVAFKTTLSPSRSHRF